MAIIFFSNQPLKVGLLALSFDLSLSSSNKMATLPSQMFKSKELACVKYNLLERISVIEASSLDSSRDGTLFAARVSERVHVRMHVYVYQPLYSLLCVSYNFMYIVRGCVTLHLVVSV